MDFAHYQSPTLLGSNPLSHINMASLGQTCGDYPIHWQNLGRLAPLTLQNKFVGSTLNSKSPLLVQSLKILRSIPTSVALAGLVIPR